jgi:hypothetical protein
VERQHDIPSFTLLRRIVRNAAVTAALSSAIMNEPAAPRPSTHRLADDMTLPGAHTSPPLGVTRVFLRSNGNRL